MEQRVVFLSFSSLLLLSFSGSVDAYKNYTVGDSLGWYDTTVKSSVDYQKWADGKNFSLGDFLIFNTDTNHSVVQTYNFTTYKLCDYDNSGDNDTVEWSSANPSNTLTQGATVAVPLLKEGPNYFFSGDYDGEQCDNGQHFKITVSHGKGLPDSLKDPSDQAPAPNAADYDSTPDTVVPFDFNNPHDQDTDVKKDSGSISLYGKFLDMKLNGVLLLLGIVYMF
ncbi:BLUE COPPER PROTEIN [Salix viminalis]|uniref:BLUE COPPER PROTEIN n=1 Tax=Salix viminalis TaxID=40686 RepID=A0A9Q0NJF2_SALVM|nr:BLUE COPPER PROTEIN [Salix viminalis]